MKRKNKKRSKQKTKTTTRRMQEMSEKLDIKEEKKPKEPEFTVMRDGNLLLKAEGWKKTHEALTKAEQQEETVMSLQYDFTCYPLDGIVAVNRALQEEFGYTEALREGFWRTPPTRLSIKTGLKTEVQAYAGMLAPPAWEGGYIQMHVKPDAPMSLMLIGNIKRKFEPSINRLYERAKQGVRENSIYKGQAVEQDMRYIEMIMAGHPFNPVACAPKFMDVSNPPPLILPRDITLEINIDIWDLIRRPDDFRYNKIPVKRGVLLSGPFGTGKTLTSAHTAKVAVESGWSFFALKTPQFFVNAYEMAQFYAPSVLFVEDVDKIFSGGRTEFMNMILDTLDGVATKGAEVITIFTTNFPEKINAAFMRSGRLDSHIQLRPLDGEAAGRFIETYSGEFLHPEVDLDKVGGSFDGLVPADVTEGINKAKRRAIGAHGREIKKKVTTEMLIDAGEVMLRQRGLYSGVKISQEEFNLRIIQAGEMIKHGHEIPVEFESAATDWYRGRGKEKAAPGKVVETLEEGNGGE